MRIETSLTGVSIVESPFHFGHKLVVLQAPAGDGEEAGGRLRDKALEDKVGTETLDEVDDEVDVFIGREEVEIGRIRGIFGSHASTLDELELVELEQSQGKVGKDGGFMEHCIPTLPRKSEDEMSTDADVTSSGSGDGIDGLSVSVTTIDTQQRRIIHGLDTIFNNKEGAAVQLFQIVEQRIGHAVGTGANDETHDIGDRERFLIFGLEMIERIVGVCIGLEVGKILHLRIFSGKETLALLELLGDGFLRNTIVGIEGLVVAISAAAYTHPTVAIRTGEARVERDLLSLHTQLLFEPKTVFIVSFHCTNAHQSVDKVKEFLQKR